MRSALFCAAVVCGAVLSSPAADPEPKAPQLDPKILDALSRYRQARRAELELELKLARRNRNGSQVSRLKSRVDAIDAGLDVPIPLCIPPFHVGDIGRVAEGSFEVISVVNPNEAIVQCRYGDFDTQTLWLKGWSTEGLADDVKFKPSGVVYATKTRSYTTVLGATNQVVVLEAFEEQPYVTAIQKEVTDQLTTTRPASAAPDQTPSDAEAKAAAKLRFTKKAIDEGQRAQPEKWLREIIRDYPQTKAASEAANLLTELGK